MTFGALITPGPVMESRLHGNDASRKEWNCDLGPLGIKNHSGASLISGASRR